MKLEYPVKILLAWREALAGNKQIKDWLIQNGYPELGLFVHAINNDDDAKNWLLENKHPHLLALINAGEGNPNALLWLRKNNLDILEKMALVTDNDDEALAWLVENADREFVEIAIKMREIKNQLQRDNDDAHKINLN